MEEGGKLGTTYLRADAIRAIAAGRGALFVVPGLRIVVSWWLQTV